MTIINRIEELRASGLNDTKVKAMLTLEDYSAKDITAAFKELGGAKAAKGFAACYYDWLTEHQWSAESAIAYINGDTSEGFDETSANVKKHLSHYMNIWSMADKIRGGNGEFTLPGKAKAKAEPESEPEQEPEAETEADEKSAAYHKAWDKGATAKEKYEHGGRKPSRNAYHPDKVAKFEDAAITELYTELFKMFT